MPEVLFECMVWALVAHWLILDFSMVGSVVWTSSSYNCDLAILSQSFLAIFKTIRALEYQNIWNGISHGRRGNRTITSTELTLYGTYVAHFYLSLVGLSTQDLNEENDELAIQIKECRQRTSMIRLLIEELDRNYEDSKRFIVVQRYRLLKSMIKTITHSCLV